MDFITTFFENKENYKYIVYGVLALFSFVSVIILFLTFKEKKRVALFKLPEFKQDKKQQNKSVFKQKKKIVLRKVDDDKTRENFKVSDNSNFDEYIEPFSIVPDPQKIFSNTKKIEDFDDMVEDL